MRSFRSLVLLAVAAALATAGAAVAATRPAAQPVPSAVAAGGDVPPPIPAIVQTRLDRAQASLGRMTAAYDDNQAATAVVPLSAAVSNLSGAWNGTKYLIQATAPPPEEEEGAEAPEAPEQADDALTYAGPEDTAFAVFMAQHDFVSQAVGIAETTDAALATQLANGIAAVQAERLKAIEYIHTLAPPPAGEDGTAAAEEATTWDTVMPQVVAVLDDEMLQIKGRLAMNTFSPAVQSALESAQLKAQNAKDLVNQYWAAVPEEG